MLGLYGLTSLLMRALQYYNKVDMMQFLHYVLAGIFGPTIRARKSSASLNGAQQKTTTEKYVQGFSWPLIFLIYMKSSFDILALNCDHLPCAKTISKTKSVCFCDCNNLTAIQAVWLSLA